jgi:glyoxylase-like metal-dependent hydrolase (beta-lactamase superfamily II)
MSEELGFKRSMDFTYGEPSQLAPGVARLVAPNPGPFTFKGTNTYLVGGRSLAVIDPGPDDPAHCEAILRAAGDRPITHIVVTHTHRDHVDGLQRLQLATGAKTCGFGSMTQPRGSLASSPSGDEFVKGDFKPDIRVGHGDRVGGEDWSLLALHTPGHAPDHLCFALEGQPIVFSGDHVMAWNTSVVAPPEGRMSDYLRSLEILLGRRDELFLPGHGGRLTEPQRTVKAYLLHRRWREQAILAAIEAGHTTIRRIVPVVYRDLDDRLTKAAMLSVLAHVEHLIERGLLACEGPPSPDRVLSRAA